MYIYMYYLLTDITSRIINVASIWHRYGIIDFDKYDRNDPKEFEKGYARRPHYGESKLAQIMHATYLQMEIFNKNNLPLIAVSLHPGTVNTNICRVNSQAIWIRAIYAIFYPWILITSRNCRQGAQTTLFCAMGAIATKRNDQGVIEANKGYELLPGAYHVNCQPCPTIDKMQQSTNIKEMHKLWLYCCKVLNLKGLKYDFKTQELVAVE